MVNGVWLGMLKQFGHLQRISKERLTKYMFKKDREMKKEMEGWSERGFELWRPEHSWGERHSTQQNGAMWCTGDDTLAMSWTRACEVIRQNEGMVSETWKWMESLVMVHYIKQLENGSKQIRLFFICSWNCLTYAGNGKQVWKKDYRKRIVW